MSGYNKELCDLKHDVIDKRLKELKYISWGILGVLVLSYITGLIVGDPLMTAKLIINVVKMVGGNS